MRTRTLAVAMTALTLIGAISLGALKPAAASAAATRIDMKVLLLGATGSEPSFQAWQAQLQREGVPYDAVVASAGHTPITASTLQATLPDGTQEAKYQAVIVATGGLLACATPPCTSALSAAEWTALETYEAQFHVRQLTAYAVPGPTFGLNAPTFSGMMDNQAGALTATGAAVFPYLRGPLRIDAGTFGYEATPAAGANFNTLVTGPNNSSLVGVYTHPDGREEMVQTVDGNQFQLHSWLLRHGELQWVTRGVYLGLDRNFLELQIDDVFLPDDSWDATAHATNFDPAAAIRMSAADVAFLSNWERQSGIRMDMVYNGGGSALYSQDNNGAADPLLPVFQADRSQFGWINHTYDHPNIDCSTRAFISREITDNVRWAQSNGFPVNGSELVTGEHSGLANLMPGNPGTIDPPSLDDATAAGTGGTLPAAAHTYAVTATSANGETIGSTVAVTTTGTTSSVLLSWDAICQATSYRIYRQTGGAWTLVGTVPQPSPAFNDAGPIAVSFTDTGAAGSAGTPPTSNTARLNPYAENPNFVGALADAGVRVVASDTSKPYPVNPYSVAGPTYPAGASFVDGPARAVPRYPTNVYYNVATQAQLTDEYNYLYNPPPSGACVPSAVTTCQTASSTWAQIEAAESARIFGHMMGNDPRPHYFHQTNIAQTNVADGGVLYPVINTVLGQYTTYFAANAPIIQLSPTDIGNTIAQQDAWTAAKASGVSGYIEGNVVVLTNGGSAVAAPLSGTEVGDLYGGARSGWASVPSGTSQHTASITWPGTSNPPATPPAAPVTTPVRHDTSPPTRPRPVATPPFIGGGKTTTTTPPKKKATKKAKKVRCKVVKKVRRVHGKRKVVKVRVCKPVKKHTTTKKHKKPAAKKHTAKKPATRRPSVTTRRSAHPSVTITTSPRSAAPQHGGA